MAEDLMQTQTGGEGETIQSTPVAETNPEQFDVKLPQANQTEPPVSTEPPVQAAVPVEPPPMQQQSMIDNQQIAEDIQTEVDSEPVEEQMPIDENVGYLDWYSGDKINRIIDNDIAKSMAQQKEEVVTPDDVTVQPQEPQVQQDIKVRSINGIPVSQEGVDDELNDTVESVATDESIESQPVKVNSINGIPVEAPKFEGVGKLPIMPLGVESDDFLELRNKYKDYDLETDVFGNVKATKKVEEKPEVKKGKTEVDKPVKEKVTIKEGQTLSYEFNTDFDYKIEDGFWRRKRKGANTWQTLTNKGSIDALNNYFKTNIPSVKIYKGKPGYDYAIIDNQWNIRKKGDSNWMTINNAGRIESLNKMHKKNISVPQTGLEKELTKAGKITGAPSKDTPMEAISTDKTGRAITEGTNRSLLFSSNNPISPIYQSQASIELSAKENRDEIERQRQLQLSSAKTEAQRQKINQDFDKELVQSKERQKVEEKTAAGVSKGIAEEVAVARPIVKTKTREDILAELNIPGSKDVVLSNIDMVNKIAIQPLSNTRVVRESSDEFINQTYNRAKNFAEKDLDAWRKTTCIALTDEQFKDYKEYQNKVKLFIRNNDDLSILGASILDEQIGKVDKQFEATVENNKEINRAADMGQSLFEYQLDQKRKKVSKLSSEEELLGKNEMIGRQKQLFNATVAIHDFVNDYINDGSVYVDANGNYKVNSKLPTYKKEFIENKLGGLIEKYESVKKTSYNTFQEDIDKLRYEKRLLVSYVSQQQDISDDKSKSPEERRTASLKVKEANRKIYGLNNDINDLRTNSGSLLSTDPEMLMMSISGVAKKSDLEAIFKATDKNLTPKQRFDIMYDRLDKENERLARAYNIDTGRLDRIGARFRSLLDWESIGVKLTPQEEKYFANQKVLNALLPAYLNNEIGITEGSSSFFDSIQNNLTSFFIGEDMAGAQGDMTQSKMVGTALNYLKERGFEEKDFGSPIKLKELEKRQNVDWVSAEGAGEILAPTIGIIFEMLVTKKVSLGALDKLKGVSNLVTTIDKSGKAIGYGDKVEKVYKAYEASMKSSKLGKAMFNAVEQGVMFEATGQVFGKSEDDMGFLQGAAGSLAGQLIGGIFSKLTPKKSAEVINKVFGVNADKAVNVLKKAANITETATGETAQEFGEELASIYQSTLEGNGFFEELESRFGTFDKVMKFVISTSTLGAGMGIAMGSNKKADELKEAMSPEDRQRVEDALTAVRETLQDATGAMNVAAETAAEEIKAEQIAKGEAIPDGKAETEREDSAITFDVDGIIKTDQEIEQQPEGVTESSFKEPIDLTDDKKDETRIPSEERKGKEPIQAEPVAEAGKEEVSPSGVLQEEEQVEAKPARVSKRKRKEAEPEVAKAGGAVTDKNYNVAQEVNNNVAKANPDASVLLTPKGDDLSLKSVYVGKEKRGKGIGTKVLKTIKSEADRTGKKIVLDATNELDTETNLERLSNFYEKNGFTKVGDGKFEYNPQEAKAGAESKVAKTDEKLNDNIEQKINEYEAKQEAEGIGTQETITTNEGKKVTRTKRKAPKNTNVRRALDTDTGNDLRAAVLKYFISGGKISTEGLQRLYGNRSRGKSIKGEIQSRIGLVSNKKGLTVERIAEQLWAEYGEEFGVTDIDFVPYVESVVNEFIGTRKMIEEILSYYNQSEDDYYRQKYGDNFEGYDTSELEDAESALDYMTDEEIVKMANEIELSEKQFIESQAEEVATEVKPETVKTPVKTKAEPLKLNISATTKKGMEDITSEDSEIERISEGKFARLTKTAETDKNVTGYFIENGVLRVRVTGFDRFGRTGGATQVSVKVPEGFNEEAFAEKLKTISHEGGITTDNATNKVVSDVQNAISESTAVSEKIEAEPTADVEVAKTEQKLTNKDLKSLTQDKIESIYDSLPSDVQDKISPYGVKGVNSKTPTRFFSELKNAIGEEAAIKAIKEGVAKPQAEPTADVDTQFDEAYKISKMPIRSPKRKTAIADFDAKHGKGSYNRISKIDSNFDDIVKEFQDKKVITKEC